MLTRAKQMHRLRFPRHIVTDVVVDTEHPWSKNRMEYNDAKRAMSAVFLWVVLNFHSKRKCTIMFKYIANYLHEIFGGTSAKEFQKKLWNRWKNGTRTNAAVRTRSPTPT